MTLLPIVFPVLGVGVGGGLGSLHLSLARTHRLGQVGLQDLLYSASLALTVFQRVESVRAVARLSLLLKDQSSIGQKG